MEKERGEKIERSGEGEGREDRKEWRRRGEEKERRSTRAGEEVS